ncbi:hypothetical protein CCACVL1_27416 [Corchorus capsularis]|uniref:F-box domain-containing protein n=1 Tax=Corchorus capsularis TaxID=210143 RepID=A0A1R3GAM2_COCAP|nr:hypothetical protein CCACVL1_27416 [Corchorus capsularis]
MKKAKASPILLIDEIVDDILERLPAKSLKRFKLVSKPWNSLISDPNFAESHLHRLQRDATVTPDKRLRIGQIYSKGGPQPSFSLYSMDTDGSNREIVKVDCDYGYARFHDPNVSILGSCNGLLFLSLDSNYILWNPTTSEFNYFRPGSSLREEPIWMISGLVYVSSSKIYKGITSSHHMSRMSSPHDDAGGYDVIYCYIYDFKQDFWSYKDLEEFPYRLHSSSSAIMVNGVPHWCVYRRNGNHEQYRVSYVIVYFDLETEEFKEVDLPEWAAEEVKFNLGILGGCLCMCLDSQGSSSGIEVWTMKEYGIVESWTKSFVVSSPFIKELRPLCFIDTRKNQVLMGVEEKNKTGWKLIIFNLIDKTEKVVLLVDKNVKLGGAVKKQVSLHHLFLYGHESGAEIGKDGDGTSQGRTTAHGDLASTLEDVINKMEARFQEMIQEQITRNENGFKQVHEAISVISATLGGQVQQQMVPHPMAAPYPMVVPHPVAAPHPVLAPHLVAAPYQVVAPHQVATLVQQPPEITEKRDQVQKHLVRKDANGGVCTKIRRYGYPNSETKPWEHQLERPWIPRSVALRNFAPRQKLEFSPPSAKQEMVRSKDPPPRKMARRRLDFDTIPTFQKENSAPSRQMAPRFSKPRELTHEKHSPYYGRKAWHMAPSTSSSAPSSSKMVSSVTKQFQKALKLDPSAKTPTRPRSTKPKHEARPWLDRWKEEFRALAMEKEVNLREERAVQSGRPKMVQPPPKAQNGVWQRVQHPKLPSQPIQGSKKTWRRKELRKRSKARKDMETNVDSALQKLTIDNTTSNTKDGDDEFGATNSSDGATTTTSNTTHVTNVTIDGMNESGDDDDTIKLSHKDGDGTLNDGTKINCTQDDGTSGDGTLNDGTKINCTQDDGTSGDGTLGDGTEIDGTKDDGTQGDCTESVYCTESGDEAIDDATSDNMNSSVGSNDYGDEQTNEFKVANEEVMLGGQLSNHPHFEEADGSTTYKEIEDPIEIKEHEDNLEIDNISEPNVQENENLHDEDEVDQVHVDLSQDQSETIHDIKAQIWAMLDKLESKDMKERQHVQNEGFNEITRRLEATPGGQRRWC